jgi:hypothetical protein
MSRLFWCSKAIENAVFADVLTSIKLNRFNDALAYPQGSDHKKSYCLK